MLASREQKWSHSVWHASEQRQSPHTLGAHMPELVAEQASTKQVFTRKYLLGPKSVVAPHCGVSLNTDPPWNCCNHHPC
jgi:hypothetical protein